MWSKPEGQLSGEDAVDDGQDDEPVDAETDQDRGEVETQLHGMVLAFMELYMVYDNFNDPTIPVRNVIKHFFVRISDSRQFWQNLNRPHEAILLIRTAFFN